MIYQSIGIGIAVSFIYFELAGLSPGGIVVPGYLALFFDQPARIGITLAVAFLAYYILRLLSNYMILYGRRRFLTAILLGFLLKWVLESVIIQMPISGIELQTIGYIIPGLIANEMKRQGFFPTLYSLTIVTGIVRLINILF